MKIDRDSDTRHTIKQWGQLLAIEGMELTLEEAMLFASLRGSDYMNEDRVNTSNMAIRLQRMEIFLSKVFPGYNDTVQEEIRKAIAEEEVKKKQQSLNKLEEYKALSKGAKE